MRSILAKKRSNQVVLCNKCRKLFLLQVFISPSTTSRQSIATPPRKAREKLSIQYNHGNYSPIAIFYHTANTLVSQTSWRYIHPIASRGIEDRIAITFKYNTFKWWPCQQFSKLNFIFKHVIREFFIAFELSITEISCRDIIYIVHYRCCCCRVLKT